MGDEREGEAHHVLYLPDPTNKAFFPGRESSKRSAVELVVSSNASSSLERGRLDPRVNLDHRSSALCPWFLTLGGTTTSMSSADSATAPVANHASIGRFRLTSSPASTLSCNALIGSAAGPLSGNEADKLGEGIEETVMLGVDVDEETTVAKGWRGTRGWCVGVLGEEGWIRLAIEILGAGGDEAWWRERG
jgi:hypothetical protein